MVKSSLEAQVNNKFWREQVGVSIAYIFNWILSRGINGPSGTESTTWMRDCRLFLCTFCLAYCRFFLSISR